MFKKFDHTLNLTNEDYKKIFQVNFSQWGVHIQNYLKVKSFGMAGLKMADWSKMKRVGTFLDALESINEK